MKTLDLNVSSYLDVDYHSNDDLTAQVFGRQSTVLK